MNIFKSELLRILPVAGSSSISEAAVKLGLSQPQLSKLIKGIETDLGFALFVRRPRGIELTEEGRNFLKTFKGFQKSWQRESQKIFQHELPIRIAGHAIILERCLPGFWRRFEKLTKRSFEVSHCPSLEAVQRVVAGEADLAFAVEPAPRPSLVMKTLYVDKLCVWRSKETAPGGRVFYNPQTQGVPTFLAKHFQGREWIAIENYELLAGLTSEGLGEAIMPSTVAESKGLYRVKDLQAQAPVKAVFHKEWLSPTLRREIRESL